MKIFSWEKDLVSPHFFRRDLNNWQSVLRFDISKCDLKYFSSILPRSNDMNWFWFFHSNSMKCTYYVNYMWFICIYLRRNIWDKVNTSMKHLKTLSINTKLKLLTVSWHFRTKRKLPVLKNYKCCPTKYLQYFFLFNSPLQVTGEKVHWHIISCNIIQFHL